VLIYLTDGSSLFADVKSSNILICKDAQLKLADFGLACMLSEAEGYQASIIVGTPNYM
jgi:serine/threonine protein kinase